MKGYLIEKRVSDSKNLRLINLILSAAALWGGITIYILFRNNDYLSTISILNNLKYDIQSPFVDFLKCHFTDFLWAFSFCCALTVFLFKVSRKSIVAVGISVSASGAVFEICQLFHCIRGTYDFIDILMYCLATAVFALFNLKLLKN